MVATSDDDENCHGRAQHPTRRVADALRPPNRDPVEILPVAEGLAACVGELVYLSLTLWTFLAFRSSGVSSLLGLALWW